MKPRSITRRVVNIILIAELAAAIALSVVVFFHEEHTRLRALDLGLRGRADSLLGAIQDAEDPGDNVYVDPAELRLPPQDYWAVFNADGSLVGHSAQAADWRNLLQPTDGITKTTLNDAGYRLLQRHAMRIIDRSETGGIGRRRPVILLYAAPETHIVKDSLASASFYILAALLVSIATAVAVAFFLRISLQPVVELAAAAESLTLPSLQFTPSASVNTIEELRPLSMALSTAVENLRAAFAREKRFVGDAAHELKTATAVVRSTIQLLMLKGRTPEQYQAGLHRALEDTERLQNLIAHMLDLAAVEEAGRQHVSSSIDLAGVVRAAADELQPMSSQAGVELHAERLDAASAAIAPDQARILVVNLLSNAIQYSSPQQQVVVSLRASSGNSVLSIRDYGCGIGKADLPHVFERFYRADPSRSRETGGAGLGLAICKTIADRTGASIRMESEPGKGTLVTVTFMRA